MGRIIRCSTMVLAERLCLFLLDRYVADLLLMEIHYVYQTETDIAPNLLSGPNSSKHERLGNEA